MSFMINSKLMKILLFLFFVYGCSLVEKDVQIRINETKIRNMISSQRLKLQACNNSNKNILLNLSIGKNKQVSYFKIVSKKANKQLTDCLFEVLDLLYFANVESNKVIKVNYLLTVK